MIIYFMGIDGAGKSTISDIVKKKLEVTAPCDYVWARYEPKLVKLLIAPFRKNEVKSSKDYNNMSEEDYSSWSRFKKGITKNKLVSKMIYFLQYIDYSFQIRNVLQEKTNHHIIVDRFVLDFLVDQTLNHGNIENSIWTKKLLKRLDIIDKIIFINVSSKVALSRKSDIPSKEYLDERRAIYLNFANKLPNAYIVTNDADINDTMKNVYEAVEI